MKKLLKDGGFTLVELMVVVAIIGILSAVAIPNFKQYQAKSKTSEGKLQLAAIYSAETAFMSDWDTFASCLTDMGYTQTAKGYYAVGFSAAATTPNSNAVVNGATCASTHQITPSLYVRVGNTTSAVGDLVGTVPAAGSTFTVSAAGKISSDVALIDTWTIDENKSLLQTVRGY